MTNHYHIVVETVEGNLSLGMRQLNGVYAQCINRSHQCVGHVFQRRYKGILVEKDSYLLALARSVVSNLVLNPLRAGRVRDTAAWPWRTYHAMIGSEAAPAWLQTDWLLGHFSPQCERAIKRTIDFVREGVGLPSVWAQLRGQVFLGSDAFLQRMLKLSDQSNLAEIPRAQRSLLAKPLSHYRDKANDAKKRMTAAFVTGGDGRLHNAGNRRLAMCIVRRCAEWLNLRRGAYECEAPSCRSFFFSLNCGCGSLGLRERH